LHVHTCENYDRLSAHAAALVAADVERKHDLLLCPATGSSPTGTYRDLARRAATDPQLFRSISVIALDEWGGLAETDPGATTGYLKEHLLTPLGIPTERFTAFDTAADPATACGRIRAQLERIGPIDVCVLGLGVNGHIGFNEPTPSLVPHCHVARLSEESRRHAMARAMKNPPEFGLTLGMREILAARHIILLVTGDGKQSVAAKLLGKEVTTMLPASLLWLHDNVDCLVDMALL